MDYDECAELLSQLKPDGEKVLKVHCKDYNEILLHVLAGELINEPLLELLKFHKDDSERIQKYCNAIEFMWKDGNEEVVNVVDITILEGLSDDDVVWQKYGSYISDEFKKYINEEVLVWNLMMSAVKPLV